MEFLFEIIFEVIVDGALELSTSRRVPIPLRILATVLVVGIFGGVIFLIVLGGIGCLYSEEITNGIVLAVLLFVFAGVIAGVMIWRFAKFYRSRGSILENTVDPEENEN